MTAGELSIASRPGTALATRLALAGWLATVAMAAVAFLIQLSTGSAWIEGAYGFPGFTSLFALAAATVGAVVVARRPANPIGRLLLLAGAAFAFQSLYTEYGIASYVGSAGRLPFADIAAWLVSWAYLPPVLLLGPVLLSIFPDGRLLSPRWRLTLTVVIVDAAAFAALAAFASGPINNFALVQNPFGVIPADVAAALIQPVSLILVFGFFATAASLVLRYRRSDAVRRQQLKWIAVAAVALAAVAPLGFTTGKPGQLLFIVALCGIPAATGIAILRYRLYDIDTIINRALVYGLLTAIIAGIYTASIGVMQRVSATVGGASSEATIVITTVLIVTAFTPIKTRLQALVDRRFKDGGDAKAALEAFTRELHERTWALEPRLVLRRFAELLSGSLRAPAVEVSQIGRGLPEIEVSATSDLPPGGSWSTSSTVGSVTLRLSVTLGVRGMALRDEEAVVKALATIAEELAPIGGPTP